MSKSGHIGVYEKKENGRHQSDIMVFSIKVREDAEDRYFKPILEDYGEYVEKTRLERNVPGIKWYPDRARWRVRIKKMAAIYPLVGIRITPMP